MFLKAYGYLKGVSSILTALLLLTIAIASSVLLYYYMTGFTHVKPGASRSVFCERIRIVYAYRSSGEFNIAVMNIGDCPVSLSMLYFLDSKGNTVATVPINNSLQLSLWGGDVWNLKHGKLVKIRSGQILYDEFNTLNTGIWEERKTGNAEHVIVKTTDGYLYVNVSKSSKRRAVAGISTRKTIQLPRTYIIETELWKYGEASLKHAVCLYITSTNSSNNPRSNTPWMSFGLYYKRRRQNTKLQIVYRSSTTTSKSIYTWSGSIQPHVHVLANVSEGAVTMWAWNAIRDETPEVEGRNFTLSTIVNRSAYVFLVVENPTTNIYNGRIGYVKIYRSLTVTLKGLKPGWMYKLVDEEGNVCAIKSNSESIVLNFMNPPKGCESLQAWLYRNGFPWRGMIVSEAFRSLSLGETRIISVHVTGTYEIDTVKVCTAEGVCVTAPLVHS